MAEVAKPGAWLPPQHVDPLLSLLLVAGLLLFAGGAAARAGVPILVGFGT